MLAPASEDAESFATAAGAGAAGVAGAGVAGVAGAGASGVLGDDAYSDDAADFAAGE